MTVFINIFIFFVVVLSFFPNYDDAHRDIDGPVLNIFRSETTGQIGDCFTISCINLGPVTEIKWLRNDTSIASITTKGCLSQTGTSPKYEYTCDVDAHTYYLHIPEEHMTDEENNTYWSCHNNKGLNSNHFTLHITDPVKYVEMFLIQDNQTNNILKINCTTSPTKPAAEIEWIFRNGTNYNITRKAIHVNGSTRIIPTNVVTLQLTNDIAGDAVYCSGKNSGTKFPVMSNTYIINPPDFQFKKSDITTDSKIIMDQSDSIILKCDDTDMEMVYVGTNRRHYQIGSSILLKYPLTLLQNLTCFDAGIYSCKSNDNTSSASLFVQCEPEILNKNNNTVFMLRGEKLTLFVNFSSNPYVTVNWTFIPKGKGEELNVKQRLGFNIRRESYIFVDESKIENENISGEDSGDYIVTLENDLGLKTESFKVFVKDYTDNETTSDPSVVIPSSLIFIILVITAPIFIILVITVSVVIARKNRKGDVNQNQRENQRNSLPRAGYDGSYRDNVLYIPTGPEFLAALRQNENIDNNGRDMQTTNNPDVPTNHGNAVAYNLYELEPTLGKNKNRRSENMDTNQPIQRQQSERAVSELQDVPPLPPRNY